jgi:hypothetical protein
LIGLVAAWSRRKRFEADLLANAVGRLFAGSSAPQAEAEDVWRLLEQIERGQ